MGYLIGQIIHRRVECSAKREVSECRWEQVVDLSVEMGPKCYVGDGFRKIFDGFIT